MKICIYSIKEYFKIKQNILEFSIFIAYVIGCLSEYKFFIYQDFDLSTIQHINILFRLLTLLSLSPLLRVILKIRILDKIIRNILFSIQLLKNIFLVFFIILVLYGFMGFLFYSNLNGFPLNRNLNFTTLYSSMQALFKVLSGDTWSPFFFQSLKLEEEGHRYGEYVSPVFYISFMIITRIIIINIHQSVIITQIEEYYINANNIINFYKDNIGQFKISWNKLSRLNQVQKDDYIQNIQIIQFLKILGLPLGCS